MCVRVYICVYVSTRVCVLGSINQFFFIEGHEKKFSMKQEFKLFLLIEYIMFLSFFSFATMWILHYNRL